MPDPGSIRWHVSAATVPREHLYAPGNLAAGMELSMAPLESHQGWRCVPMGPPGIQFDSRWCHLPLSCLPPAGTRDPPPPQSLHQGQTLRLCWDGVAFLLFIFTFLGFSLSFPWLWATQMHFQGAAGMSCRQHCSVSWLCVFQPCWTLRMAARES